MSYLNCGYIEIVREHSGSQYESEPEYEVEPEPAGEIESEVDEVYEELHAQLNNMSFHRNSHRNTDTFTVQLIEAAKDIVLQLHRTGSQDQMCNIYERYNGQSTSVEGVSSSDRSLEDIVPDVDAYTLLDTRMVAMQSRLRFEKVSDYLDRLQRTKSQNHRLSQNEIFRELQDTLFTVNSQYNTLFSIDFEQLETNSDIITEIGISIYDPLKNVTSPLPNILKFHIIIQEHEQYRNGKYVDDNRYNFLGGRSIVLPFNEAGKFVQTLIDYYFIHRQEYGMDGVLVGHCLKGDIKALKALRVILPGNIRRVDTQRLFKLTDNINRCSLGPVLQRLEIPHSHLHNAGNDAYFTLLLSMKLADPDVRQMYQLDSRQAIKDYKARYIAEAYHTSGRPVIKSSKPTRVSEFRPAVDCNDFERALKMVYGLV